MIIRPSLVRIATPLALVALVALSAAACGDETSPQSGAQAGTDEPGEASGALGDDPAPSGVVVDDEPPVEEVSRALFVRETRRVFDDWGEREAALVTSYEPGFAEALGKLRWFKRLTTQAYEQRKYRPLFSEGTQLTEGADALLEALYGVTDHGIDPEPYDLDGVRAAVKRFSEASLAYQAALEIPAGHKPIWDFLMTQRRRMPLQDRALVVAAGQAGFSDADVEELTAAREHLDALLEAREELNHALRDLDIALATRYFRYIYDMRYARRAHPFFADKTDGEGIERTAEDLAATFAATDFSAMQVALDALVPKHPDYAAIKAGLARYRAFAASFPEHIELPKSVERLKRGAKEPELVKQLQERLAQEEYYDGPVDGQFGEGLEQAINTYQDTHQIKQSGRVDRVTRVSLNKPFSERARQLELSLRRHRESELHQGEWRFGDQRLRARINVPAFEAYFFRDGELARTHRVIVGNNAVEVNFDSGKKGRFNQTRMFSAEMRNIVLNPWWRVPKRIKEQELDLKLIDEPDFYEKHNYEVTIRPDGTEVVAQRAGSGNALGLVKFLFPNKHAIYMHDTPGKRLFNRTLRAFSHGCMRTENPLDLARWILIDNGDWTEEKFDRVLASREETHIALKDKIPVTIDYNTIGVHAETGRMMFYADIYDYDEDYFAGKTPYRADRDHEETVIY